MRMSPMKHRMPALLATVLAAGVLAGCGSAADAGAAGEPRLVASFYPLQFATQRIAGDRAEVSGLTPPGAEPHDLELRPKDVGAISKADLVVYLKGFQPSVDEAVENEGKDAGVDVAPAARLDLTGGAEEHEEPAGTAGEEGDGGKDP